MSEQTLQYEIEELRHRLEEAEDTLRAIRSGEVDAVVVSGSKGEQVYVLKGAEQPYRVFLETMQEGAVSLLADGTIAYSNQRFADLLSTPLERVIGAALATFIPPDQVHRLRPILEKAVAGPVTEELPLLTANGIAVWVKLSMCPAQVGADPGICLVATDVTERNRANELRAYLASIVDSSDDAIIGTDLDGTILSWNRGAERLYGYSAKEAAGHSVAMLCPPDRAGEPFEILARIARGESVERHETERLRKGGRKVQVSLTVSPIRDLFGRIEGASVIARDITRRKQAEDRLRQSEEQYRTLFNSIDQGFCTIEILYDENDKAVDYRFLEINPSFEKQTGIHNPEGRTVRQILPRNEEYWYEMYSGIARTGEPARFENFAAELQRWYDVYAFRIGEPDERRVAVLFNDITARKRAENELRKLNEELDRRVQERTAELQTVLDAAPSAIWIAHDPECRNITGNLYADETVMRVPRGSNISAAALPGEAGVAYKMFRKGRELRPEEMPAQVAAATGRPVRAEEEVDLVFEDGRTVSLMLSAAPLFTPEGHLRGVVATGADVTSLRKAEQSLRESEERYRRVVQNTSAIILRVDPQGIVRFANDRALEFFGYSNEELLGKHAVGTIIPERETQGRDLAAMVAEIVIDPDRFRSNANENMRKNGERVWVEWTNSGIYDPDGRVTEILAVGIDATERNRAETALEKMRKVLVEGQKIAHLGTFEYLADTRTTVWSDEEYRIYGLDPAGSSPDYDTLLAKCIHAGDAALLDRTFTAAVENRSIYELEHRIVHPDGSVRWVFDRAYPYFNETGKLIRYVGATLDITGRKEAEAALYEKELRLRLATEAAQIGAFDWNLQTDVNVWTPELERMYGLPVGGFARTGTVWENLVHPEDRAQMARHVQASLETGAPTEGEWRVIWPDGSVHWLSGRWQAFKNADGAPLRMTGVHIDITERKQAEEALRESETLRRTNAYTRSLIEASLDPLVTIDRSGKLTDVNRAAEKATGLARPALIGTEYCEYFTEPKKAHAAYERAFHEGLIQDCELEIRNRDGHLTPVLYNASVYRDATGEVAGVFAAARDITERKRSEEALARQSADLARSNAELQQFAYVASHDLQEPLRAVASFTKLLSERYHDRLDADANDFIGFAVDGARRAQSLINDLLAYSRVGTRGKPFARTDCERVLLDTLADLAFAIEDAGGQVTHDPLPVLEADETQLAQLLRNLIGNALKFHGAEAPRVHVSAERIPGAWRFSVRDHGIGIDSQYAETIFEVFRRLHSSTEFPGTGIGLAIAKKIVERHGGHIWVESQPGAGSTFFFTIPAKRGAV